MGARRRSPRRRARRVAALVLALFALGWLADRAHGALEPHRWCAEHGRAEHGHAEHGHAAPAHADVEAGRCDGSGPELGAGDVAQHHACCVLLARGENPPSLPQLDAAGRLEPAAETAGLDPVDRSAPRRPIALVLLAPKQSPPRA